MEIAQNDLLAFFKKASYNEDIEEVKIKFAEEGIIVDANTQDMISIVKTTLNADKINNYKHGPEVVIKNVPQLMKYISRLSGSIDMQVTNNMIVLKTGNKTIDITLADEKFIQVEDILPLLEKAKETPKFDMSTKLLREILQDAVLWKDTDASVYFYGEPGKLKVVMNMGTDKIVHEYPMPNIKSKFSTGFRTDVFDRFIKTLTAENITFQIMDMFPIIAYEQTDTIKTVYLMAPFYTDEQKVKEAEGKT